MAQRGNYSPEDDEGLGFAREWYLGRKTSATWYAAPSHFGDPAEHLRRANPFVYYVVADPSLLKPEPKLDLDSWLGLNTEADKHFFKECKDPRAIREGEARASYWARRVVLPTLKLGSVDPHAASRITGITLHDTLNGTIHSYARRLRHFEAFDAESGVIRTGLYSFDDDELVHLNSFGTAYEDSHQVGSRDWTPVEVKDGGIVIWKREKGLANHHVLTVPAAACINTTIPNLILWERSPEPWLPSTGAMRAALSLVGSSWLPVAPHGKDTSNHPVESHDRDSWSLCASPARSKIAPARLAA